MQSNIGEGLSAVDVPPSHWEVSGKINLGQLWRALNAVFRSLVLPLHLAIGLGTRAVGATLKLT